MIELVTFAALRDLLGLEGEEIADYPALAVLRDSVTAAIEGYLGRGLELVERTHSSFAGQSLRRMIGLSGLPVASVASVQVGEAAATLSAGEYSVTAYGIMLAAPVQYSPIQIVYTGGYAADAVPAAIARAALIQTAYEFQSKDQIGAETISNEGGTVTRPALQILREARRMLDPYKHPLAVL